MNGARAIVLGMLLAGCAEGAPSAAPRSGASAENVVITSRSQLEANVGRQVTIIGVQQRTKIPTVCGVDVDGDYALSDREVIVAGELRRTVVTEVDNSMANRGAGTFYLIVDPATGVIAKTKAH